MVFCYDNCSNVLWEKIVLVIEKNFWNVFLTCSWRFLRSQKILGSRNLQEKLENNSVNSKTINNSAYPIPIHKLLEESRVFVSILSLLSTTVEPWYSSKVHWKVPVWQNLQQKRLFIRFCTLKLKVNIWKIPLKSLFIPLSLSKFQILWIPTQISLSLKLTMETLLFPTKPGTKMIIIFIRFGSLKLKFMTNQ